MILVINLEIEEIPIFHLNYYYTKMLGKDDDVWPIPVKAGLKIHLRLGKGLFKVLEEKYLTFGWLLFRSFSFFQIGNQFSHESQAKIGVASKQDRSVFLPEK